MPPQALFAVEDFPWSHVSWTYNFQNCFDQYIFALLDLASMHIEIPEEEVVQVASEKLTALHGQSLRKIEEAL